MLSEHYNNQHYLVTITAGLTLCMGAGSLFLEVYLWWRFHLHIPLHDLAEILPLVIQAVESGFFSTMMSEWLLPHADAHRITVTRLLMYLDYLWADGQNHFIYASTFVSIATILVVNVRAFTSRYGANSPVLLFVVGLSLLFLTSQSQLWNLLNPINSSWYVTLAAGALSVSLITNEPSLPSGGYLFAAFSLAVLAAFSTFSGVMVWLILPILIAIRNVRAGLIAALAVALFLVLYLPGISPDYTDLLASGAINERSSAHPVLYFFTAQGWMDRCVLLFNNTLMFLGTPLSITHPRAAVILVIASLLGLIYGWFSLLKQKLAGQYKHDTWFELNLALSTICLGTAISTGLGRLLMAMPTSSRFQTVVMVYWLCICGLVLAVGLKEYGVRPLGKFTSMSLCLALAALFLTNSSFPTMKVLKISELAHRASNLDRLGVPGINMTLNHVNDVYLSGYRPIFEKYQLSHMAKRSWSIKPKSSVECADVELHLSPSEWPGILTIQGTIDDYWSKGYREIAFSDERGEVIGFLYPFFAGSAVDMSSLFHRKSKWAGFVRTTFDPKQDIYLYYRSSLDGDSSCRYSF